MEVKQSASTTIPQNIDTDPGRSVVLVAKAAHSRQTRAAEMSTNHFLTPFS